MTNRWVVARLEKHGDKFEVVREVSHWIYFESSKDRQRFIKIITEMGYRVLGKSDSSKPPRSLGVTVASDIAADQKTIDRVVLELFDLAIECGGEYDGWETSIIK
jgi:regulator of RNase E activity RraB